MDNRLSGKLKPYLTSKEVTEILGFNEDWLSLNKQFIGYSKIGGALRFKRADVEEYIEKNYHKINRNAKY
jgi:predicted DNA-binding transcriptional regulator AlpA